MSDLRARATAWLESDPDPETRAELAALLANDDMAEVAERMNGTLEFGTAGLRGAVEAGSNRMNRAVVIRTTRGLADHLLDHHDGDVPGPVVIGRDARLSSPQFMEDAVAVLAAAGLDVRYWEGDTPTPVVAYGALALGAVAAIVVTASHNPPQDNGYKVYDANGAQIVPPVDRHIAAAIDLVGPANEVPRVDDPYDHPHVQAIDRSVYDAYQRDIAAWRSRTSGDDRLRIVYTPMHGVGWQSVRGALHAAGYQDLHPVPEQVEPDGAFPTVAFPNPEEPGALDLSFAHAERVGADLVLANDPDADRLAVAVPFEGTWRALSGNQIGVLLADHLLGTFESEARPIVINSIVSSPMLADVAALHDARFEQTLTGFKWIANAALDLEAAGEGVFVFGYEEALGYTVGPVVRDKDGVSAALAFADLAAACRERGQSIMEALADLYRKAGMWISTQKSIVRTGSAGAAEISSAMKLLESDRPGSLGGAPVKEVTDFRRGETERPRWLPAAALVVFHLEGGGRVLVRPSGTEPKLKIYADMRADVAEGDDPFALEPQLQEAAAQAAADLADHLGLGGSG